MGTPASRDRDERGRPRQARPRDAFGRPLSRGAVPSLEEAPPPASPEEALALGIEQFNAGRYFQAHEIWEDAWHPSPEPERDFWQGLIQIAVGLTHRQRGNAHGAVTLLRRGAGRLRSYGESHRGVPCARLVAFAEEAADAIQRVGPETPIVVPTLPSSR